MKTQKPSPTQPLMLALLVAICSFSQRLDARLARHWSYNEMFEQSDFVVIGRVTSSNKSEERTTLPDYTPALNVVGMITKFQTCLVLKGSKDIKSFDLHHYAYASQDDEDAMSNTPFLIKIRPGQQATFLLFLTRTDNGVYIPVTGQTDPAFLSVLELQGAPD
jgi:hypothetical protein